jgi:hypothetical protein
MPPPVSEPQVRGGTRCSAGAVNKGVTEKLIWNPLPLKNLLARRSRGFGLCCGGPGLGGYPRDGCLSLFHGLGYIGHQLFQIVLGGLKLRRLRVHFHLPIRRPREKGFARSIQGQSE